MFSFKRSFPFLFLSLFPRVYFWGLECLPPHTLGGNCPFLTSFFFSRSPFDFSVKQVRVRYSSKCLPEIRYNCIPRFLHVLNPPEGSMTASKTSFRLSLFAFLFSTNHFFSVPSPYVFPLDFAPSQTGRQHCTPNGRPNCSPSR